jgi:hypothetical protein
MWDIIKIILYVVFAIILTLATVAVAFIAWALILTSPILIPAIVIIAIIGTMIGYIIARK